MIVGVDVSSKRIDLAWLEDGKPHRWHQQLDAKAHLIDRLRSIRIMWPHTQRVTYPGITGDTHLRTAQVEHGPFEVTDVAIEYPFGRGNAVAALMATVGVITRQAPPWARVAWPSAGELRAAIGAKNTKESAHTVLMEQILGSHEIHEDLSAVHDWDEHELDALVACLGWTRILEAQEAA